MEICKEIGVVVLTLEDGVIKSVFKVYCVFNNTFKNDLIKFKQTDLNMMKFLLSHIPSCGNQFYSISVYEGDRPPLNGKISNDPFVKGDYEKEERDLETTISDIKRRMNNIGEDPDDSDCRDIYSLLYETLCKQKYNSIYTKIIEDMITLLSNPISEFYYKKGKNIPVEHNGFFEFYEGTVDRPSRIQGFVYQISGTPINCIKSGQEIHIIKINNGDGCMTSTIPLALFFDDCEASLFENKVNDALKHFILEELGWCECIREKHVLNNDMTTFRISN